MAPISVKHLEDERQCLSQLGVFSKLPTEIRLVIWEAIFPDSRKPQPDRKYRRPVPANKMANILCSSRFLYHEISTLLYRNLKFRFIISNGHDHHRIWIRFQATSERLHVNWSFSSATATKEKLSSFPFSRSSRPHFEIEIYGAECPGLDSLFIQWIKVNSVVDFLKKLPISPYVHVSLLRYWVTIGSVRQHIHYLTYYSAIPRPPSDHDVLILPFFSLTNWHYTLPADLGAAILKDPEALKQTQLHLFKLENPTEADGANEVCTTFDTSEMSQTHYVYEPRETSRIKESARKVDATFRKTMLSLMGRDVDVGVGDESQGRQLLATYDRIWNLLFLGTQIVIYQAKTPWSEALN